MRNALQKETSYTQLTFPLRSDSIILQLETLRSLGVLFVLLFCIPDVLNLSIKRHA